MENNRASNLLTQSLGAAVLNTVRALVVVLDRDGRVLQFNRFCEELTGYTQAELLGRTIWDLLLVPEEVDSTRAVFDDLKKTGLTQDHVNDWRTRQGERRTIHWSNTVIRTDDGQTECIVGTGIDLTEQRRVEKALQASENRLQLALEAAHMVAWSMDAERNEYTLSSNGPAFWGADIRKAEDAYRLIHPDDLAAVQQTFRQALAGAGVYQMRYRTQALPGYPERWMEDRARGQYDAEGNLVRVDGIVADITAQVQAEEALVAYAARLEKLNQEIQQFAYIVSHDLQEPLRKIISFSERLQQVSPEALGPEGADYLARMRRAAERMRRMILDLLEYSRVSTRSNPFEPTDLTELVRDVISDLELRLQLSKGKVELGELPAAEVDRTQFHYLLKNLIDNGLKFYAPERPPLVQVRGRLLAPAHPSEPVQVEIEIEDNGIGFDAQYEERIFQPFQRLHGRSEYEGTGMGLAISRKIIERHHGTLTTHSSPGQGAVFTLRFPQHKPPSDPV